jgi:hypothetical protein
MVPPRTFQPDGRAHAQNVGERAPAKRTRLRYEPNMIADPRESAQFAHGAYVATTGFPDTFRAQRIASAEWSTQLTLQSGSLVQTEKRVYASSMSLGNNSSPSVNLDDVMMGAHPSSLLATRNTSSEISTEQMKEPKKASYPPELRDTAVSLVCFRMASMITITPNTYPDSSIDLSDGC